MHVGSSVTSDQREYFDCVPLENHGNGEVGFLVSYFCLPVQGCVASDIFQQISLFFCPTQNIGKCLECTSAKIVKCEYSNSHWKSSFFENFPIYIFWYQTISTCTSCMGLEQYLSQPTKSVNYFSLPYPFFFSSFFLLQWPFPKHHHPPRGTKNCGSERLLPPHGTLIMTKVPSHFLFIWPVGNHCR